jgi:hypothetical protein
MGTAPRRAHEDIIRAFEDLESLALLLDETLGFAAVSLQQYRDAGEHGSGGWFHLLPAVRRRSPGAFSKASTATCLSFVRAADLGLVSHDQAQRLVESIVSTHWKSAGLDEDNPFTVSFLLEALRSLVDLGARLEPAQGAEVDEKLSVLKAAFDHPENPEHIGGIAISPYPPTAFLTFKAVRTLRAWNESRSWALDEDLRDRIRRWGWACLHEESVLVASEAEDADAFELAYAVLTVSTATELQAMTPPQRATIAYALDQFFACQNSSGTWPRSRPLFLYPEFGDAYCYDYELLVALLSDKQLRPMMRSKLNELRLATSALEHRRFPLNEGYGWSSGHLRQVRSAESWSTASVFHYCYELQRLVADELRETVFDYIGERVGSATPATGPRLDRTRFLDSAVDLDDSEDSLSLVDVLEERFLAPLVRELARVEHGTAFSRNVPMSAILYGPPGTSKTQLAGLIAGAVAWPLLKIDPSHLTRQGLDRLHAEAYRLFGMLQAIERAVVLLDEFDELVREREGPNEVLSRFLTTAMLPKLAALSDRRRLVVLLATNHLESFDIAISRPGRFDMIVPVMPPTLQAKLAHPPWLAVAERAQQFGIDFSLGKYTSLASQLADLTFAEFAAVAPMLGNSVDSQGFKEAADHAHANCTLAQKVEEGKDWKQRIQEQRSKIRLPPSP